MGFILTKNNANTAYGVIEGYVETASEIASLSTKYTPGSKVTAIDTGVEYVLISNKTWQPVKKF